MARLAKSSRPRPLAKSLGPTKSLIFACEKYHRATPGKALDFTRGGKPRIPKSLDCFSLAVKTAATAEASTIPC